MSKITNGMKDRITQFLVREGISPAEFADKIGVQRSSVSHVLNGRNYPSASFLQKMLGSYKTLNPRWLLLGEGMITDIKSKPINEPTLFNYPNEPGTPEIPYETVKTGDRPVKEVSGQLFDSSTDKASSSAILNHPEELNLTQSMSDLVSASIDSKEVERIVFFFKDKTFAAYTPSK